MSNTEQTTITLDSLGGAAALVIPYGRLAYAEHFGYTRADVIFEDGVTVNGKAYPRFRATLGYGRPWHGGDLEALVSLPDYIGFTPAASARIRAAILAHPALQDYLQPVERETVAAAILEAARLSGRNAGTAGYRETRDISMGWGRVARWVERDHGRAVAPEWFPSHAALERAWLEGVVSMATEQLAELDARGV